MEEKYIKISNRVETRENVDSFSGDHTHILYMEMHLCHLGHKKCVTLREKSSSDKTLSPVWLSTDNNHNLPSFKNCFPFVAYKDLPQNMRWD